MAKREHQRGAHGLKGHLVAAAAASVAALMLWLIPACSISSHGPGQAEAPGFGLVYEPPALFPAYYLPPTVPDHFVDATQMVDVDALYQPGETVAMNSIVVAAATGRVRELGGQLSEAEMRAVLEQAGWTADAVPAALSVAWCESRWSPFGTNGVDNGLFGLSSAAGATVRGGWLTYWGFGEDETWDPVTNALAARWTWERSGWGPWSCKPASGG